MKIFILVGHPDKVSFNRELADAYAEGAKEKGHEVRVSYLSDMNFDPILHQGYRVIQELEPDLLKAQEDIRWCNHFVIFYPSWWSTMPALLKGFFDRIWVPGFAYMFKKEGLGKGYLWSKLLKGKTARVFITSDIVPIVGRIMFGDNTNEISRAILGFGGFDVRVKKIGPMKFISDNRKGNWKKKARSWGRSVK